MRTLPSTHRCSNCGTQLCRLRTCRYLPTMCIHYVTRDLVDDHTGYSRVLLQACFSGADALSDRQPSVLIVAAKWWSTSARMAIAFMRNGCRVGAVCPTGHPLRYVLGMDH